MNYAKLLLGLIAAFFVCAPATAQVKPTPTPNVVEIRVSPKPDYGKLFDEFDVRLNNGRGVSDLDNAAGKLAWIESYLMMGYMERYHATSDPLHLRKVCDHFERIRAKRDDRLGRLDAFTSTALKGWGSSAFHPTEKVWHVYFVHSGMICQAPAEFVRIVRATPSLQAEFGTTATLFAKEIGEVLAGLEDQWRDGPHPGEGHYIDHRQGLLALNWTSAVGIVHLHMGAAENNNHYLHRATQLAVFLKNRLRDKDSDTYDWAYWPKMTPDDDPGSEDISHAAINVEFAARCAIDSIVFTQNDCDRFARTWLQKVSRGDGKYAGRVDGSGEEKEPGSYMPQSAGRWLTLCNVASPELAAALVRDVRRAFDGRTISRPSEALGIARLDRYKHIAPVK